MGGGQESKTPATKDWLIHHTKVINIDLPTVECREIVKYKIPTNINKNIQAVT